MLWWDMDGVLFIYRREDYEGEDPNWKKEGYYRNLLPDSTAKVVFNECCRLFPDDNGIITSVPIEYRNRMTIDKIQSIDRHFPAFDFGANFIAVSTKGKASILEYLRGRQLTKKDILIDDWNPNLYSWEMHGGTAIKWSNGENDPHSFTGIVIDAVTDSASDIITQICEIVTGRV